MKQLVLCALVSMASFLGIAQKQPADSNTLLWRISGKNLSQPSYLFGTIHMLCGSGLSLSDSLKGAIAGSKSIYLEIDMENMQELMSVMTRIKMNGDTTLEHLLSPAEYEEVKAFFRQNGAPVPFALLEKYKPMLAASSVMESDMNCPNPVAMEHLIMQETHRQQKKVKGLESIAFQMSLFDSIPYKVQAKQLLAYIKGHGGKEAKKEYEELTAAYMTQDLKKLETLTAKNNVEDFDFMGVLIYRRNERWLKKMESLMPEGPLVVAVGAGHLPGKKGLISLLQQAGYTVEPIPNNMFSKLEKRL